MRQSLLLAMLRRGLGAILYWLGQIGLSLGRPGRAVARLLLSATVRLQPDNTRAHAYHDYLQALKIFPQGETEEALHLLRRAHRAAPDDEALHLDWGVALAMAGRYDQAIRVLERFGQDAERAKGEQQYWSALGWAYLRNGQFGQAEKLTKQAAEHGVAGPEMQLIVSLALLADQSWIEKSTIRTILNKRPQSLGMVLEFVYYLATIGKRSEGQKLVEALAEDILFHGWRIIARQSLNEDDIETAQWALDKLSSVEPDSMPGLLMACELAIRRGEAATAIEGVEEVAAQEPADADTWETAGRLMVLVGQQEKAFRYMTEALSSGSRGALAGGVVGLHLLDEDQVNKARAVFSVQRTGDELACLYAHTATAVLLEREKKLEEAVQMAALARNFWDLLPSWETTDSVREQILPRIAAVAELGKDAEDEATCRQAATLLDDLPRIAEAGQD